MSEAIAVRHLTVKSSIESCSRAVEFNYKSGNKTLTHILSLGQYNLQYKASCVEIAEDYESMKNIFVCVPLTQHFIMVKPEILCFFYNY